MSAAVRRPIELEGRILRSAASVRLGDCLRRGRRLRDSGGRRIAIANKVSVRVVSPRTAMFAQVGRRDVAQQGLKRPRRVALVQRGIQDLDELHQSLDAGQYGRTGNDFYQTFGALLYLRRVVNGDERFCSGGDGGSQ